MPETFFGWVLFILQKYGNMFLIGTYRTMGIALSGTIIGFMLGLLVAIARVIELRAGAGLLKRGALRSLKVALSAYIEVFRGTPMMVQAMLIYYGSLQYLNLDMTALTAAIVTVSINTGAYMAEIVRGGIISIDKGQAEAAKSIGMTHWQAMVYIVLPQAVRNIMPSIGNEFVVNIKDSSVLNVISVAELYFNSKSAAGTYLRYFEVFFITAAIYFALTFTVTRILRLLEKKMEGPDSYTIHGSQSHPQAAIMIRKRGSAWLRRS